MIINLKYKKLIHNRSINRIVLRLKRKGCKFYPVYDLIIIYRKKKAKGRILDKIGIYNPNFSERFLFINTFKLSKWLNRGLYVHKSVKRYIIKFLIPQIIK